MLQIRHRRTLGALALLGAIGSLSARADDIKTVFVIAMENHNWTQPAQVAGKIQQIYQNPNAGSRDARAAGFVELAESELRSAVRWIMRVQVANRNVYY